MSFSRQGEMLTGFNTDFKYKGTVYHVQTEDNGVQNPVIVTLLYKGGAILASRKTSYADIIKFEKLDKVVRELMEDQHKQIIKDLIAGKFNEAEIKAEAAQSGTRPAHAPQPAAAAPPPPPPAEEIMEAEEVIDANMDDLILDYIVKDDLGLL